MSQTRSHWQNITLNDPTPPSPIPNPRKIADTQRRKVGRERHEERKYQLWRVACERSCRQQPREMRQEQRGDRGGATPFAGRGLASGRALALDAHYADTDSDLDSDADADEPAYAPVAEDTPEEPCASGATLLAMARPAKAPRRAPAPMTDGEAFEVVEIEGRLVLLDEDGWEVLPDENAQAAALYSEVVRGSGSR
ncbi:hypothetical protein BC834DRAFT_970085 [Gloeopeniophorella convolvens]|nr:hypothetical protein BC834DRAFT_970085 [Gloeopeniophorella convolvens]